MFWDLELGWWEGFINLFQGVVVTQIPLLIYWEGAINVIGL